MALLSTLSSRLLYLRRSCKWRRTQGLATGPQVSKNAPIPIVFRSSTIIVIVRAPPTSAPDAGLAAYPDHAGRIGKRRTDKRRLEKQCRRAKEGAEKIRYLIIPNLAEGRSAADTVRLRPICDRMDDRIRSHVFLCMLAYYVEWHMRARRVAIR